MQEMLIYGVSFDIVGKQPIVLLKTADGNKFLPIWIGHPEAAAILMKLQGASTPRPMTHDLLTDMLAQLDAQVVRITVTELKENTFYATVTVRRTAPEIEIDSRPSDAIALAVRAEAPIFVADRVIEESAIEFRGRGGERGGDRHRVQALPRPGLRPTSSPSRKKRARSARSWLVRPADQGRPSQTKCTRFGLWGIVASR